jgi:hypothetical protein
LFNLQSGVVLTNSVLQAPELAKEKTEAQKIQEASLRAQAEAMRNEYHPPTDMTLSPEAAARFEKWKENHAKEQSLHTIFRPKLYRDGRWT